MMDGFALLYGHDGQHAAGDPKVAELLSRTVEGQFRATQELDTLSSSPAFAAAARFSAPRTDMVLLHRLWTAEILWQMATAYLDGVVEQYESIDQLPDAPYTECDELCDAASAMTLRAIKLRSRLQSGDGPRSNSLAPLPELNTSGYGYVGVWRAFEAVYLQVADDVRRFQAIDVPRRMAPVIQAVTRSARPQLESFEYLALTWSTTRSDANRKQVIGNAVGIVSALFALGQQMCDLTLLGTAYADALAYVPTLHELGLGFDPWLLTDPTERDARQNDPASIRELAAFWESTDHSAAQDVARELAQAVADRRIRLRTGRGFKTTPWAAQYLVRFPIHLGTRDFEPGQLLTAYVRSTGETASIVEIRRSGRVQSVYDMLGQPAG